MHYTLGKIILKFFLECEEKIDCTCCRNAIPKGYGWFHKKYQMNKQTNKKHTKKSLWYIGQKALNHFTASPLSQRPAVTMAVYPWATGSPVGGAEDGAEYLAAWALNLIFVFIPSYGKNWIVCQRSVFQDSRASFAPFLQNMPPLNGWIQISQSHHQVAETTKKWTYFCH